MNDQPEEEIIEVVGESNIPDDATQTLTAAEIKELLDYAFAQGRMRGYAEALQTVANKVNEDAEITDDIKEYLNSLLGGI